MVAAAAGKCLLDAAGRRRLKNDGKRALSDGTNVCCCNACLNCTDGAQPTSVVATGSGIALVTSCIICTTGAIGGFNLQLSGAAPNFAYTLDRDGTDPCLYKYSGTKIVDVVKEGDNIANCDHAPAAGLYTWDGLFVRARKTSSDKWRIRAWQSGHRGTSPFWTATTLILFDNDIAFRFADDGTGEAGTAGACRTFPTLHNSLVAACNVASTWAVNGATGGAFTLSLP